MKIKRFFATALVAVLLCIAGTPLFAAAVSSPEVPDQTLAAPIPPTAPAFTAELVHRWEGWGLYGTLSEMTEDITAIVPCYSMDGEDYIPEEYNAWQLDSYDPDLLRQQCFGQIESPLKEFLAEEIDRFYVKLQITYEGGSIVLTEAVPFDRAGPAPLPAEYQVQAWYAVPIRNISCEPPSIRGQYHFTVPNTATPEELKALLPQTVPVELQIYRDGDPTRYEAVVDYAVQWQEVPPPSTNAEVLAASVTPPEACAVTIGSVVYRVKPPEILPENGPELCATFIW